MTILFNFPLDKHVLNTIFTIGSDWDHINCPDTIDLNTIRLCFQVIGFINGERQVINAIMSNPVANIMSSGPIKVSRISHTSASVLGGQEVIILTDKVKHGDIRVRIVEEDGNEILWRKECRILDVHNQFAIVFRTPVYKDLTLDTPQLVYIHLYRPSDMESSEAIPFELLPSTEKGEC